MRCCMLGLCGTFFLQGLNLCVIHDMLCAQSGGFARLRRSLSAIRKRVVRMKDNDFISLSAWLFSLISLLIAVYMLGKGL